MMISEGVAQTIVSVVKQLQPAKHYKLFLFGSRVSGKATNRSDYDVGIESKESIATLKLLAVKEALEELPILQKIDLVDFATASEELKKNAKKNMKVLYEQ